MIARAIINGQTTSMIPFTPLPACVVVGSSRPSAQPPATALDNARSGKRPNGAQATKHRPFALSVATSSQRPSADAGRDIVAMLASREPSDSGLNTAGDTASDTANSGSRVGSPFIANRETAVSPTIATQDAASPKCPTNAAETAEQLGSGR